MRTGIILPVGTGTFCKNLTGTIPGSLGWAEFISVETAEWPTWIEATTTSHANWFLFTGMVGDS